MKITKEYKGITRKENGDYYISGSIITDENIVIELDDRLIVEDSIVSMKGIASNVLQELNTKAPALCFQS